MKNKISKNVYENILIATLIMLYFIVINFLYCKLSKTIMLLVLKTLSMIVLTICITILEYAFRKDSGKRAITGIEILILAGHTLSIAHIVESKKFEFANYILVSSYIFSIYYLFKAIFIYTKERREYLNSLSDIKEIVSNDPVKKVATKKGVEK